MNVFPLPRIICVVGAALVVAILFSFSAVANAVEPKLDDNLHFTLIPYIWLPSVNGRMTINLPHGSSSSDFDANASKYMEDFNFAAMVVMELEKGDWSLFTDFMYVDFSGNNQVTFPNLPGGRLDTRADTGIKAMVLEGGPAYSLYRSPSTRFDFLAGVRYLALDTDVTLNTTIPLPVEIPSRNFSKRKDLVDPIVGIKGRFELGKGWFIPYYFDAGGFGINNEWSWQAYGGIGYHFSKLFSMTLAYRHLQYNFNDNNNLLKDFYLSGAQLGFVFRF